MGYYVPYRHSSEYNLDECRLAPLRRTHLTCLITLSSVPLWDMETDYYLHNFHVKTGKGTLHSMKGFQRAFGVVEWNEDEDGDYSMNEKDSATSSNSLASSKVLRPARPVGRSVTSTSVDSTVSKHEESRISKVRRRCTVQNQALSSWWKIAIQANIQQRMWMQLSRSPAESLLPPRFERCEMNYIYNFAVLRC